ncbi:hypothetical protein CKALI_02865 [Corynebacterium kalinowskii]|uniref:Lipoprotein LpqH n=1 Tax=Corynebacterium kalinowskii TaxID=2675216 RepID=A0A6B8W188_9CORY|nr:lipoprotein LpqH [Corynebacterium kalinowskii]QGU01458.1 hypothetical protein CKALI_02865 [Corynebacterium kalinowskii]
MTTSTFTRIIATGIALSCALSGCTKQEATGNQEEASQATASAIPHNATQQQESTGSAYLNGYQILPAGTHAVCSTFGETRTVIIGDMPSKNAASFIMDGRGVRALSIADAEDSVEFTEYTVPVQVTHENGILTVSGQAEGTRMLSGKSQLLPMTFVVSVACP